MKREKSLIPQTLVAKDFFTDTGFHLQLLGRFPQVPFPLHSHDFSELVIVTAGTGIHFSAESEYKLLPGDVFVIEAGFSHGYREPDNLCLYNLIFDQSLLKQTFLDIQEMPGFHAIFSIEPKYRSDHAFASRLRLDSQQMTKIISLIEVLDKELHPRGEQILHRGNRALAMAYFIEIIVMLSRIYTETDLPDSRMIMRLADAFTYIEHNRSKSIALEELSSISGMSVSTLNRAFHKATGFSPIEYHIRLKVEKACHLLRTTHFSMGEISELTGFSDSNYFSRQFKNIMQCSPLAYKKQFASK